MRWLEHVRADPLPWLLEYDTPAVRAATLQRLLGDAPDRPRVREARLAAMDSDPIKSLLATQDPAGWWAKPGPGYSPKYRGTVWQVIFLDQLGADARHPQVARACDYVLDWTVAPGGGFGASGIALQAQRQPSRVIHSLNGNLLRALIGLGRFDDERVQAAIDRAARSITGDGMTRWYASGTSGPGVAGAANDDRPCTWGALKELAALARIPFEWRSPLVRRAIAEAVAFLLSRDPLDAEYPMGGGNTTPGAAWFRPGFPWGYLSDVLQTLEVLADLGHGPDQRIGRALRWLESRQDAAGRWRNRSAYNGRTWVDFEEQGAPSKWVTLRVCTVLRAAYG
jgi:hypothetical protein